MAVRELPPCPRTFRQTSILPRSAPPVNRKSSEEGRGWARRGEERTRRGEDSHKEAQEAQRSKRAAKRRKKEERHEEAQDEDGLRPSCAFCASLRLSHLLAFLSVFIGVHRWFHPSSPRPPVALIRGIRPFVPFVMNPLCVFAPLREPALFSASPGLSDSCHS
jgi:hypothetical protein